MHPFVLQSRTQDWFGRALKVDVALDKALSTDDRKAKIEEERKEETRLRNREKRHEKTAVKAELKVLEAAQAADAAAVEAAAAAAAAALPQRPELPADVTPAALAASAEGRVLVVSGFTADVAKDRILASMKRLAPVQSILYPSPESLEHDLSARITFETKEAAAKALKRYHNKDLRGCTVRCLILSGVAGLKAGRLIVRNVGPTATEVALAKAFGAYGEVVDVVLPRSEAGFVRGFAFVQMANPVAAEAALALNGSTTALSGTGGGKRAIVVDWALSKEDYLKREAIEAKLAAKAAEAAKLKEAEAEAAAKAEAAAAAEIKALQAKADKDKAKKDKKKAKAAKGSDDDDDDDEDDAEAEEEDSDDDDEDDDDDDDDDNEADDGTSVYRDSDDDEDEDDDDDEEEDGKENSKSSSKDDAAGEDDDLAAQAMDETLLNAYNEGIAAEKAAARIANLPARSRDIQQGCTLFIRNLSFDTDEESLYKKFSQYGHVKVAKIVRDRALNRSMGTGFVQFDDKAVVNTLLSLYGPESAEADAKQQKKDRLKRGKVTSQVRF